MGILDSLFGNDEEEEVVKVAPKVATDITPEAIAAEEPSMIESAWDSTLGGTSKIKSFNPETKTLEEVEMPTWRKAAKSLAQGLKTYGLTVLANGGDVNAAMAAGIEKAFGNLDSEDAATAKYAEHQKTVDKLMTDGKFTPSSVAEFARTGNPASLKQANQEMSAIDAASFGLDVEKQAEVKRSNLADEGIARMNANTSQMNAATSRFNSRTTTMDVVGPDGNKYIQPVQINDDGSYTKVGDSFLKDSAAGIKVAEKAKEVEKSNAVIRDTADTSLGELDLYLNNPGRIYEATEGLGLIDKAGDFTNTFNTEATKDRGNLDKYIIGDALETLASFKGATTDFEYLKAESKNVNPKDAKDVERFLKKVRTATVKAKVEANGKTLGTNTGKKAPAKAASGSMSKSAKTGKSYIVLDGYYYEVK